MIMILGVDVGNYYTKTSTGISFISKVSSIPGILANDPVTIGSKTMYLGEGECDTEYRKAYKESYLYLLLGAILKSTTEKENKIVVGLPLSQYKADKGYLINRILQSKIVKDIEVQPEGAVSVPVDYTGIVVDIGGGTTDICLVVKEGRKRKIVQPYSLPKGILNLESEFINCINAEYGLDLLPVDADRIIKNGLYIYGERQKFSMDIYKEFVESIVRRIQVDYSLKTNNITLVGGGANKLYRAFKKRIPQTQISNNCFYANANAYAAIGRRIWGE
ncbi:ParM/StbA family protein [Clostridium weizhouense]|uniref:ParM/StbA family protein n=1 Tax=Clostridium weizhouense TaxID=2859781 RepID=A0ABS7AT93_9CLOT|nr:ParM/StbA family protein [Clostridium weizhouense]MBW6411837.1 ParM/StbA family protein [Clostridium weizhouense]